MYKVACFRPTCPPSRLWKSSFRILPLDTWAHGLCTCELQACRDPQGPERAWAADRKWDWTGAVSPRILESEKACCFIRSKRQPGRQKKFRPHAWDEDWVWVDMPQMAYFRAGVGWGRVEWLGRVGNRCLGSAWNWVIWHGPPIRGAPAKADPPKLGRGSALDTLFLHSKWHLPAPGILGWSSGQGMGCRCDRQERIPSCPGSGHIRP